MAKPNVTCGADLILDYNVAAQSANLSAVATNGPILSWQWTILSVPPGSTANVGAKGDFTNGVATIQNPTLLCDAAIDGGYTVQCIASNAEGASNPLVDKHNGQQATIVRTQARQLSLPGDYLYNWGETYLNPNLRLIESFIDRHVEIPFWEWDGVSTTDFDLIFGSSYSSGTVSRVLIGGIPHLKIAGSSSCAGASWLPWAIGCLITGPTLPSKSYYIKADVLLTNEAIYDSYPLVPILGVRCDIDTAFANGNGYIGRYYLNVSAVTAYTYLQRMYGSSSKILSTMDNTFDLIKTMDPTEVRNLGFTGKVGAELGSSTQVLLEYGNQRESLRVLDEVINLLDPIDNPNYPLVGFHRTSSIPSVTAEMYFSNIRLYEYKPRLGV